MHLYHIAVDLSPATGRHLSEGLALIGQSSAPVDVDRVRAPTSYSRRVSSKARLVLPVLALLGWCILCAALSWRLFPGVARAESGPDEPPTPVIRTVTPVVVTVVPVTDVVTPEKATAETAVGPAQASEVDKGDSAEPFGWGRGIWIGIGAGVLAAGLLAAAAGWRLRRIER